MKEYIISSNETKGVFEFLEKIKPLMIQKNKTEVYEKIKYFFEYGEFRIGTLYIYKFLNETPMFIEEPLESELEDFYWEFVN